MYTQKLIISGKHIELYKYELPVGGTMFKKRCGRNSITDAATKQRNREKIAIRARNHVRRLINANPEMDKFFTITFAENITDIDYANNELKNYIKVLKYHFGDFKYVVVTEFQQRGAIHFHMVCTLPYVDVNQLTETWGNGFCRINRTENVDNIGAYVTKYMTKAIDDRLRGKKCYRTSRNLNKPIEITDENEIDSVMQRIDDVKNIYTSEFSTETNGICEYTSITLKKAYVYRNFWQRIEDKWHVQFFRPTEYLFNPFSALLRAK